MWQIQAALALIFVLNSAEACKAVGKGCQSSAECCDGGYCMKLSPWDSACRSKKLLENCQEKGGRCSSDENCCSRACDIKTKRCDYSFERTSFSCVRDGKGCNGDNACCSRQCVTSPFSSKCAGNDYKPCTDRGDCYRHKDCCSGECKVDDFGFTRCRPAGFPPCVNEGGVCDDGMNCCKGQICDYVDNNAESRTCITFTR